MKNTTINVFEKIRDEPFNSERLEDKIIIARENIEN